MKWIGAILVSLLTVLHPVSVYGLSCARPKLDKRAIESAAMIFEGVAGAKRRLNAHEKLLVRNHPIRQRGGRIENLRVYRFHVTRGWKGALSRQTINVLFNTTWGDGFAKGGSYLVVSPRNLGKLAWAPLCGHTTDSVYAAKIGNYRMLEELIVRER